MFMDKYFLLTYQINDTRITKKYSFTNKSMNYNYLIFIKEYLIIMLRATNLYKTRIKSPYCLQN